jgi:hypothetical protein
MKSKEDYLEDEFNEKYNDNYKRKRYRDTKPVFINEPPTYEGKLTAQYETNEYDLIKLNDYNITEDVIFKDLIKQLVNDMNMEQLSKLFKMTKEYKGYLFGNDKYQQIEFRVVIKV